MAANEVEPFETERLRLRPYTLDDLDDLALILGDPEGMVSMGGAFDMAGSRSWIERNLARYDRDGFGRFAVTLATTGELVGDCGLITTTVEGAAERELGWIVDRRLRGQGIATEAASAWHDIAFDTLGWNRFVSMIDGTNVASRRVAEKIGMDVERQALWEDGLSYLMYSISGSSLDSPRPFLPHTCGVSARKEE